MMAAANADTLGEDEISVDPSLGGNLACAPPDEVPRTISSTISYSTMFFRCLTCCNCILVITLAGLVVYETMQVEALTQAVGQDRAIIASLQEEVQEKQEDQIEELQTEVQDVHNLTFLTLAGIFTLLTCLISMFHMSSHLQKMNQPIIQRKIVAILWMSPIYSVTSFMSLIYPPMEGYMAIIKDFYESYCIYIFLSFLIVVLGRGSRDNAVEVLAMHAHRLERPARCLSKWYDPPPESSDVAKANAVITECQIFAMQFVFIRPLTTVLYVIYRAIEDSNAGEGSNMGMAAASETTSTYGENQTGNRWLRWLQEGERLNDTLTDTIFEPTFAPMASPVDAPSTWAPFGTLEPTDFMPVAETADLRTATEAYFKSFGFFLAMIVNISVFFAFTGLLKFYHSVHKDLAWCRPWPKFLTIKGVVFLTFWQGLAILIFVNLNASEGDAEDPTTKGRRYQNILICCEMLFFSLTHWCVFPAEEWEKDYQPPEKVNNPGIGIQDFVSDVGQIYQNGRRRRKGRRRRGQLPSGKRSPRRDNDGLYHRPMTASHMSATVQESYEVDGSESSQYDEDLQFPSDGILMGPPPAVMRDDADRVRPRFMSDGSSVKADDEEDDMELL